MKRVVKLLALVAHAVSAEAAFPTAYAWRVVNAEQVCDHWKVGELVMIGADGLSTYSYIKNVICSHNYETKYSCTEKPDERLKLVRDTNFAP